MTDWRRAPVGVRRASKWSAKPLAVLTGLLLLAGSCATVSAAQVATPAAEISTFGALADRVVAAWPTTSYEQVAVSRVAAASVQLLIGEPSLASPAADGTVELTVTNQVLYPGSVHQTVAAGTTTIAEYILVGDQFFARGPAFVRAAGLDLATDPAAWTAYDAASADPASYVGSIAGQLKGLLTPRYSQLTPNQRARAVTLAGTGQVGGRACTAYGTVDTTSTGERVDLQIAVADDGGLCSVTTRAGGQETVETYAFAVPVTIEAPADAVPASASPAA